MRFSGHLPSLRPIGTGPGSYTLRVFLIFLVLYLLLVLYARSRCFRDPTSAFFDPSRGYLPSYSTLRLKEAEAYIAMTNNATGRTRQKASAQPEICLGIASIAREGARYFKGAVGSVLEGLTEQERAGIHLILFIAHTDPWQHPAYAEPWLHELPDRVLLYDEKDVDHIRSLETEEAKAFAREKALFDYTYLLKACQAVNASYVVMLEDDVVALDGWYHRTRDALAAAERQTAEIGASKWLYLRLFYTEEFLGWNAEDWPIYLFYSILAASLVACILLGLRHYYNYNNKYHNYHQLSTGQAHNTPLHPLILSPQTILMITFICTPLTIALFFAAGRATMLPIPAGVHQMPKYGCCSQGFVFPQSRVPDLVAWYESKRLGYVDMLTEEFADRDPQEEIRWALTPSVLQHVGRKSSKTNDFNHSKYNLSVVERLWNFGFEGNEPAVLRGEHEDHVFSD